MAAVIHAKRRNGKKLWYVYGANGNKKWEHEYPQCDSKADLYNVLRRELGLSNTASDTEVVFELTTMTWTGTEWMPDFALRLKALRERAGLTQSQLAELSGLSVQAIAALEQGARRPAWDTVQRLARSLEVGEETFKISLPRSVIAASRS